MTTRDLVFFILGIFSGVIGIVLYTMKKMIDVTDKHERKV